VTPAGDPGADADAALLVRRLRRFSPREWARDGREEVVRAVAADLAALTAPGRPLPDIPRHALADAIAVLAADALSVAPPDEVRRLLRAALDATR
jgi:hypothetical protein